MYVDKNDMPTSQDKQRERVTTNNTIEIKK